MSFLSPAYALLAAAALIPVIIHLAGRSRAQVRPFAAMHFLRAAHRRVATRTRLRQLLLMLLRAAVMAAVPLILARPFFETTSDLPAQVSGAQSAVLVIDDSLSMAAQAPGGGTLLARARARALRIAAALPRDAEVAVLAGARGSPAPLGELTTDRGRVTRAIESLWQTQRGTDLVTAVKRAAQVLQAGRAGGRRVYVLSDMTAHALEGLAAPADAELVLVDVTDGKPLPNRAVTDLRVEPAPSLGSGGVRVQAEVANFSDAPLRELTVTLWVDGKPVARGLLDLPARGRAVKRFFHVIGRPALGDVPGQRAVAAPAAAKDEARREEGVHDIAVELPRDGLPTDDRRVLRMERLRSLRVLVIDGDPRNLRRDDEVFYLETALRPGDRDDSQLEVVTALPEELGRRSLRDFDAVFLCNVKAQELSRGRAIAALREYVEGGGGLLLSLGDNVEPEGYNSALGELLPQPLAGIKTAGPIGRARAPGEAGEIGEAREGAFSGPGERVGRVDRRHPIMQPFGGQHGLEGLLEARFGRFVLLRPTPKGAGEGGSASSVLTLEGGAPLLVERVVGGSPGGGGGRVMLFTSSIDRDWNDLPIQPAFLPLLQQAARYLARAPQRDSGAAVLVGQRREVRLSELDARIEVTLPSGQKRLFEQERLKGRRVLGFTETEESGLYRVAAAGEGGALRLRPAESFAVNVDPAESDLRRASPARIEALTRPPGARPAGEGAAPRRRVELWHGLGALLLLLLLGEAVLLRGK